MPYLTAAIRCTKLDFMFQYVLFNIIHVLYNNYVNVSFQWQLQVVICHLSRCCVSLLAPSLHMNTHSIRAEDGTAKQYSMNITAENLCKTSNMCLISEAFHVGKICVRCSNCFINREWQEVIRVCTRSWSQSAVAEPEFHYQSQQIGCFQN